MVAFASAAPPVRCGVLSLVFRSVFDTPLSDSGSSTGVPGLAGAVVSIVSASASERSEILPTRSVAVAVMLCAPAASALL
jgi:hypothetical protein